MGKSHSNASSTSSRDPAGTAAAAAGQNSGDNNSSSTSGSTGGVGGTGPQLQLKLHSPVGSEPWIFSWPVSGIKERRGDTGGHEIAETIKFVCEDYPTLKQALDMNSPLKSYDVKSFESMKKLCTKYNHSMDAILQLEKGTSKMLQRLQQRPSRGLLKHIIQKVYNVSVTDPDKLNQYEPFSPEVYGETSYDLVCKIIDQVHLNENDVFIDLGSGVGQVVLQIAGLTKCKTCVGIEKAEVPSTYAIAMDTNFRKWMKWYGKKYSDYTLIKGDFLDQSHREKITGSTIVFVNNYAFGPVVDHELKMRFADLKDGARIVSSRAFCPLQFRITERTLGDIGAIIHIQELESTNGNVSWTNKPVSYYCHTVDRSKLHRYFEGIKKKRKHDGSAATAIVTTGTGNNSNDSNEGGDENVGPTTRRAWSDWCSKSAGGKTSDDEGDEEIVKRIRRKKGPGGSGRPFKKGRQKLRRAARGKKRLRKPIKILGLELLHQSTLQSTSNANLKPAPGTIDQKLTQLTNINTTGLFHHEELPPSSDTPYALQKLLELYRKQMLGVIEGMKSGEFRQQVQDQIDMEKKKRVYLLSRAESLKNSIDKLIHDSTQLLKLKLEELNIPSENATADTLLSEARAIVIKHKEIQSKAEVLQSEVDILEKSNAELVERQKADILKMNGLSAAALGNPESEDEYCHNYLLRELVNTLEERKRLQRKASLYEVEVGRLEEVVKENEKKRKRESRARSREWPEIPSIEIINEKNPEVLAKKILETGRMVEGQQQQQQQQHHKRMGSSSTAAAAAHAHAHGGHGHAGHHATAPKTPPASSASTSSSSYQPNPPMPLAAAVTPRVNFLEDRLHDLITTCLQEDSPAAGSNGMVAMGMSGGGSKKMVAVVPKSPPPLPHPHRQPPSTPPAERKKPVQLSPDIANGPSSGGAGGAGARATKNALRAHLGSKIDAAAAASRQEATTHPHQQGNAGHMPHGGHGAGAGQRHSHSHTHGHPQQQHNNDREMHMHAQGQTQALPPNSAKRNLSIGDVVSTTIDTCLQQERRASVLVAGPGMEGLGAVLQMQYGSGKGQGHESSQSQQQQQQNHRHHQQQQQAQNPSAPGSNNNDRGGGFVTEVVLGETESNSASVLRVVRKRVEKESPSPPKAKVLPMTTTGAAAAITRIPTPGSRAPTPGTPTIATTPTPTPPPNREQREPTPRPTADSPHQWQCKVSHGFDRLLCYATEARRKSTEAAAKSCTSGGGAMSLNSSNTNVSSITGSGSGPRTPGKDGESPDSGLGKDLPLLDTKRSAESMRLPRTPSPSHVDEDEELVFGGYKEWVDEPPPTPRLLVKKDSHSSSGSGSGSGGNSENMTTRTPTPATAAAAGAPTPPTSMTMTSAEREQRERESREPMGTTMNTIAERPPGSSVDNNMQVSAPPVRPPSTASSTSERELRERERPSSTASSAASTCELTSNSTTQSSSSHNTAAAAPQHFKKRWNVEATTVTPTPSGGAAPGGSGGNNASEASNTSSAPASTSSGPTAPTMTTATAGLEESQNAAAMKFRPKGKAYIQQQEGARGAMATPPPPPSSQSQQQMHTQMTQNQSMAIAKYEQHQQQQQQQVHQQQQQMQQQQERERERQEAWNREASITPKQPPQPQLKSIVLNGLQPVYNKINGSVTTVNASTASGTPPHQHSQQQHHHHQQQQLQHQQQQYNGQSVHHGHGVTSTAPHSHHQQQQQQMQQQVQQQQHYNQPPPPPPPGPGPPPPPPPSHPPPPTVVTNTPPGGGSGNHYNNHNSHATAHGQYIPTHYTQGPHPPPPPPQQQQQQQPQRYTHGAHGHYNTGQQQQPAPPASTGTPPYHQPPPPNMQQQQQQHSYNQYMQKLHHAGPPPGGYGPPPQQQPQPQEVGVGVGVMGGGGPPGGGGGRYNMHQHQIPQRGYPNAGYGGPPPSGRAAGYHPYNRGGGPYHGGYGGRGQGGGQGYGGGSYYGGGPGPQRR